MPPRLQRKEVFVPIVSGTDTEGDPRLPTRGMLTCKNADFTVRGSARKRAPLAAYYGNTETDVATALPDGITHAAPVRGTNNVVLFGDEVYESVADGGIVRCHESGLSGLGEVQYSTEHPVIVTGSITNAHRSEYFYTPNTNSNEDHDLMFLKTGTTGRLYIVGNDSGITKVDDTTIADGSIIDDSSNNQTFAEDAYVVGADADCNAYVGAWDSSAETYSTTDLTGILSGNTLDSAAAVYIGTINSTERAALLIKAQGRMEIYNVDIDTPSIKANTQVTVTNTAVGDNASVIQYWDTNQCISIAPSSSLTGSGSCYLDVALYTLGDTSITRTANGTLTESDYTEVHHASVMMTNATAGHITYAMREGETATRQTVSKIATLTIAGSNITFGTPVVMAQKSWPISEPYDDVLGGGPYQVWRFVGAYNNNPQSNAFETFSRQNDLYIMKYTGDYTNSFQNVCPVSKFNQSHPWDEYDVYRGNHHIRRFVVSGGGYVDRFGYARPLNETGSSTEKYTVTNKYAQILLSDSPYHRPVSYGDYTMIPNALPYSYDGRAMRPMGGAEYCELPAAAVAGAASGWADDAGDYTYAATYVEVDAFGNEIETAPSPSITVTVAATDDNVTVSVPIPYMSYMRTKLFGSPDPIVRIYRTETNGNLFFMLDQVAPTFAEKTYVATFVDDGSKSLSANSGLDSIFSAKSLYTNNGELEAVPARGHLVGEVHQDRYFYVDTENESTDIYYSKARKPGIAPEFNEVLKITCGTDGNKIKSLVSSWEKLFIFKQNAIYVTHGSPLNDAGVGSGYAPPRLVTKEAGVFFSRQVAAGTDGIYFVNSSDNAIYRINQNEQLEFVGGPVRYYTDNDQYNKVFYSPVHHSIFFVARNSGDTLTYDYRYGLWSTHTGRYTGTFTTAFDCPVDKLVPLQGGRRAPLLMPLSGGSRYLYLSDHSGSTNSVEDYELDITTAWFSLNDMVGYGKVHEQTLLCGIPVAGTNLSVQTAYDYDPQWIDTCNIEVNTNAFDYTNHYTMAGTTFVDQTAKFSIDGSRHKTDAIRYRIRETDGTARDNLEIVGIKLDIGVKPGNTRLGSGRSYNS